MTHAGRRQSLPSAKEPWTARRHRGLTLLTVAALLALHAFLAASSMAQKSVTTDEITYIAAGSYHLRTGDFHFNQTNPPLMKAVAALPLLALDLELPPVEGSPRYWKHTDQWHFARRFLYDNRVDADRILLAARSAIVAISMALGGLVFWWARRLYGTAAGLLSLSLYCLSPNILAHARLATQDLGLTALIFACAYAFWRMVREPRPAWILSCGALFGLAVLAKTPAFFALPAFAAYGSWCVWRNEAPPPPREVPFLSRLPSPAGLHGRALTLVVAGAAAGLVALFVLNAGYGFQGTFSKLESYLPQAAATSSAWQQWPRSLIGSLPVPLPSAYVDGLLFQQALGSHAGNVFFAGRLHEGGLWYLTLAALLIKVPVPGLALAGVALLSLLRRPREWECERLLLLVVAVFLLVFSWFSNMGGAVRYVLPVFPCVFVLVGSLLAPGRRPGRPGLALLAAALAWYVASSFSIYPHYLAYFNELVGGPKQGYRFLADSNIDWGQDLKGLKRYMDEHGVESIKLAYFGSADAEYHGIHYEYLPSVGLAPKEPGQLWWYEMEPGDASPLPPQEGLLAVSVNLLAGQQWIRALFGDTYDWLREYEPIDQVGYSILIYRIEP